MQDEITLVALIMIGEGYHQLFNYKEFIFDDSLCAIIDWYMEYNSRGLPLHESDVRKLTEIPAYKARVPYYIIEDVFKKVHDLESFTADQRKRTFDVIIKNMNQRNRRDDLVMIIEKAKLLILNNKEQEGITLLKSIKYKSDKQLPTSLVQMLESIQETNGFKSGIKEVDQNGGWLKGNMCAIAGDSGMQKTMVSIWVLLQALIANPTYKAVYFEKEMPIKDIARRLISHMLLLDSKELLMINMMDDEWERRKAQDILFGKITDMAMKKDNPIVDAIHRFRAVSRDNVNTAADMYEIIEDTGADLWCLDFATMLVPHGSNDQSYEMFMKEQLTTMKDMLEHTNTFGIVLSQLKTSNNVALRPNKIPTVDDMDWGKHIRQLSSWVFSIFYPKFYSFTTFEPDWFYLVSRKTRHGNPLTICLKAQPQFCKYIQPDLMEQNLMKQRLNEYVQNSENRRK